MSVAGISLILVLFFCSAFASFPCEPGYGGDYEGGCVICQPGSYDGEYGFCDNCQPGTYQAEAGQTECKPCPTNAHSLYGATECVVCEEGQALMQSNTCGTCPPGQYYLEGYCNSCESGFFKPGEGLSPCMPCPRNSYSRHESSECIACPEGKALMDDGSCAICPPGKFYDTFSFECTDCYTMQYTDSPNIFPSCYQCGGNSFAPRGSTKCIECPVGKVFIKSSSTCEACPPGQFYDQYELSCSDCPYNQFTLYESEKYCRYCMTGTFARKGSTTCFACPPGQYYLADTDECGECPRGEYYESYEARCNGGSYGPTETPFPEPLEEINESAEPTWDLPPVPTYDELGGQKLPVADEFVYPEM